LIFEKAVDAFEMVDHEKYRHLVLAAWTTAATPHEVRLPASPGRFHVMSHTGEALPELTADRDGLRVTLSDAPVYLVPAEPNDLLRLAAAWSRLKPEYLWRPMDRPTLALSLNNPLDRSFRQFTPTHNLESEVKPHAGLGVDWNAPDTRSPEPLAWRAEIEIRGLEESTPVRLAQGTVLISTAPLRLIPFAPRDRGQWVRVENPTGEAFEGGVRFAGSNDAGEKIRFEAGERFRDVVLPNALDAAIELIEHGDVVLTYPATRFVPISLDPARFILRAEGDKKVASEQSFAKADHVAGLPGADLEGFRITYQFDAGWKYICLKPQPPPLEVEGQPQAVGLWIKGSARGIVPRLRFVDATGQTFQPDGPRLSGEREDREWRYIVFPLRADVAHWGGAADGVIHYPIRIETLCLLDNVDRDKQSGEVTIAAPVLIYPASPK